MRVQVIFVEILKNRKLYGDILEYSVIRGPEV